MLSESITSIHGGCIGASNYDELILSTYPGWVMGLTTEPQQKQVGMPTDSAKQEMDEETQLKLTALKYDFFLILPTINLLLTIKGV